MLPRRHPNRSTTAVVGAVLLAAVALTGCSKGNDSGDKGSTASSSAPSTSRPTATVPSSAITPSTLDNDGYSKFVAVTLDNINKAGKNPCRIAVVFRDIGIGPQPTTPQQGQQAVDLVVRLFDAIAGAAGPSNASDASLVTAGAARISREAKANSYSPKWIKDKANETLGAEGLAALQRLVTANDKSCRENGGAPAANG